MKYTAAVITVSDMGSRGLRQDTSGPAVRAMLEEAGFSVAHTAILPDEMEQISAELEELRAAGKEKTVKFRELMAKKLTDRSLLLRLVEAGLAAP